MKNKELTAAIRNLQRVLADPRLDSTQRERLLKARKELRRIGRSGKLDHFKVFRAIAIIAEVLTEKHAGDRQVLEIPESCGRAAE